MESQPSCIQCGGTDYLLLDGFYFCTECNIQSQDMQERIFESYFTQPAVNTVAPENVQQNVQSVVDRQKDKSDDLTSFEILNHILKGLVDEMIQLGANEKFKIVVFQIWCTYLRKIQAAFISTTYEANPKLGFLFRRRDAELLYGMDYKETQYIRYPLRKRKQEKSKKRPRSVSSMTSTSQRSERRRLTKQKKLLAEAEYKESQLESTQMAQTLESLDSESQSSKSSKVSSKITFTNDTRKKYDDYMNQIIGTEAEDITKIAQYMTRAAIEAPDHPTISRLISFLGIACSIVGDNVYVSDFLKWIEEGYISTRNAEKHIPPRSTLIKDIRAILSPSNSYPNSQESLTSMCHFLNIRSYQPIIPFIKRYIKEFCLPADLEIVINRLIKINGDHHIYRIEEKIDAIAISYILMAMKLLFVLDDVSEYQQSDLADKINKDPQAVAEEGEQFSFVEWTKYMTARSARLSRIHYPTNYRQYKGSYNGGSSAFLSQWDNAKITYSVKRFYNTDENEKTTLNMVLRDLVAPLDEPKFKPAQIPSLTPMVSNYKAIKGPEYKKNSLSYLIKKEFREKIIKKYDIKEVHEIQGLYSIITNEERFSKNNKYKLVSKSSKQFVKIFISKVDEKERRKTDEVYKTDNIVDDHQVSFPGQYWVHFYSPVVKLPPEEFQSSFARGLPSNFFWILNEFSNITKIPIKIIYNELQQLEKTIFDFVND